MTPTIRVEILNSLGHGFVEEVHWDLIKRFVSLPPADVRLKDQTIRYAIPLSQIARPLFEDAKFYLETDFKSAESSAKLIRLSSDCHAYENKHLQIKMREVEFDDDFRLKQDASYDDVEIITRSREVINLYEGGDFIWTFEEVMKCPSKTQTDDSYLYFKSPPRFRIILLAPTHDRNRVIRFLRAALPETYNKFTRCL